MKGRTDVRTDVDDVMAIKPNFLTSMGYHIFLTMVLRARGAPLSTSHGGHTCTTVSRYQKVEVTSVK